MPQATILASGQSAANSTDVVVAQYLSITVGLFASATIPSAFSFTVYQKTPGNAQKVGTLSVEVPSLSISSPGTYYVARPDISSGGVNVGVYTEN